LPQRLGVGRLSPQQAGEGVMGWSTFPSWLTPGRFAAGEILLGGYQKVNIVQSITPGWVHSCPPPFFSLLEVYPECQTKSVSNQMRKSYTNSM
jgi:hypothetical protein